MDFIEHYQNELGITFGFKTTEEHIDAWTGRPGYNGTSFVRTHHTANSFAFRYKGAIISGTLPDVDAGFSDDSWYGDNEQRDLLPAVQMACGFPIDMSEAEAV